MKAVVKKAFSYAHDGLRPVNHAAGDVIEIHDELFEGLCEAGLVDAPPEEKASEPVTETRDRGAAPENRADRPVRNRKRR